MILTLTQLEDNISSVNLILTSDKMAKLDEMTRLPPSYPGWMFARMPAPVALRA